MVQVLQLIGFSSPAFTSLICATLLVLAFRMDNNRERQKLFRVMIVAYCIWFCLWLFAGIYIFSPSLFVYIQALTYLFMLLTQVLIYYVVFLLTQTGDDTRFPLIHFLIPLIIAGSLGAWTLAVPYPVLLYIVESGGMAMPGYEVFTAFFISKIPVFLFYNLFYSLLALLRIRRFRKVITDYSADISRSTLGWLYLFFGLTLTTIPLAVMALVMGKMAFVASLSTLLMVLLTMFQDVIIAYNMFAGNYTIIPVIKETEPVRDETDTRKLNKQQLERYMEDHKPYLASGLKITDMIGPLQTNRSYLSAFINKEYGMNFSQYINSYRLRELELMREDNSSPHQTGIELALRAGFSNYNGYLRARQMADRLLQSGSMIFK